MIHDEQKIKQAENSLQDKNTFIKLASLFKALGEINRIRIVKILSHGEFCAGDIAKIMNVDRSALSHQLKILTFHGVISSRKNGIYKCYKLTSSCFPELLNMAERYLSDCK